MIINLDGSAYIDAHIAKISKEMPIPPRPAVVVLPGGGYMYCSAREAEPVANQFKAFGVGFNKGIAGNRKVGTAVKSLQNGIVKGGRYPSGKVSTCGKTDSNDSVGVYVIFLCVFTDMVYSLCHVYKRIFVLCLFHYSVKQSECVTACGFELVCHRFCLAVGAKHISAAGKHHHCGTGRKGHFP